MGKLYVGNLPFETSDEDLKAHFEQVAPVSSAKVIMDRETGRSRGFGFVEMDESDDAMDRLNGGDMKGRPLTVNIAREKERREPSGGRERSYR